MAATRSSSSASVVLSTPSQAVSPKGDTDASKGGVARASFNFINSIIGAGVISLPFAFREAGFVAGVILLFVMAALTYYSVTLLVNLGVAARVLNYEMLARSGTGPLRVRLRPHPFSSCSRMVPWWWAYLIITPTLSRASSLTGQA
ncbi:hypothetical protein FNF31_04391 [Cafeteria roenbergensis]|uniref:Amino acid transporter transmembrane domain-containing protein n=1 Tax=Cafeteria roenbergensis TaxID=33653 RepID=A0A5A8D6X9_CAFRO|nr:hypothetical protein FNF31_04391 [Cafeteria roenbergensis]